MNIITPLQNAIQYHRDKRHVTKQYETYFSRPLRWNNPTRYSELINIFKISEEAERLWPYVDKYEVRSYVRKTVGEEYLNEVYRVYDNVEDIHLSDLPQSFALKATHGSTWNILCKDKNEFDWEKEKSKLNHWMHLNYYHFYTERQYKKIKPRIVCERFLSQNSAFLECRIFCFGGKVMMIDAVRGRFESKMQKGFYTPQWEKMNVHAVEQKNPLPLDIPKPKRFDHMLHLAAQLAAPFRHVRVDINNIAGKLYFGELTFTSGSGFIQYVPDSHDEIRGTWFLDANPSMLE